MGRVNGHSARLFCAGDELVVHVRPVEVGTPDGPVVVVGPVQLRRAGRWPRAASWARFYGRALRECSDNEQKGDDLGNPRSDLPSASVRA